MPASEREQPQAERITKTHKTAVVLVPPESVWEAIQAIRRKHDRQVRRWMPHITLLYPFLPPERFNEVEPALRAACGSLDPFEVRLAEFHRFEHGGPRCTLWLAPEPREAMVALQARLQAAVPHCDDVSRHAHGFTPHLSVGQVRGIDRAAALVAQLRRFWTPVTFPAEQISVIQRDAPPNDIFRVDRTIQLGR